MERDTSVLLVVGGGPVGLSLAVGLAQRGHRVQLVDAGPDPRTSDKPMPARSTALMPLSLETLEAMGVWARVADRSAPLDKLRLIDDQADRWTKPVIETFSADEVAETPFGFNIINTDLIHALLEAAEETEGLSLRFGARVADWRPGEIVLEGGETLTGALVFDASGRKSPIPAAAGISIKDYQPNQAALVCQVEHSLDHGNISTEFQRREGPLTTVPLP
ncbi:MAG: FAD-dependent oxidoreductase, partial [Alphaproteobacteria bacterium]